MADMPLPSPPTESDQSTRLVGVERVPAVEWARANPWWLALSDVGTAVPAGAAA